MRLPKCNQNVASFANYAQQPGHYAMFLSFLLPAIVLWVGYYYVH